jgi:hypothetical protein
LKRDYIRLRNLPDWVEREIKTWERQLDPSYQFSEEYLTRQRVLNAIFNGFVQVSEAGSGKLVAETNAPADRPSRRTASSN